MERKSHLGIVVAILAILTCALIGAGIWYLVSHPSTPPAKTEKETTFNENVIAESSLLSNSAGNAAHAQKLEGATETTDGNGIVHGTTADGISYLVYGRGQEGLDPGKVSFAAVGDVFATNMNLHIADAYSGSTGDSQYDFKPYYRAVSEEVNARDLRLINQETPCAGTDDGREYTGYPVFNTPDSSIHSLADVGFNIANFNSNHTWDMGEYGILRSHDLFAEHPGVALIGSYASAEDRSTVHMVERNGTTFALLSYSYGDNWYGTDPAAFPNNYYTCQFDKAVMADEIARAKKVADAVVVYMHWGSEYVTDPKDEQLDYAQFLADQDVDLVIGSHAHIMQPIRYVTGASGKRVPVVYGLSDFITGWTLTDTILSGMFTCDFVWHDDKLEVENCAYLPAIEWSDGGDTYVRFLKDMTTAEIDANTRTSDVGNDSEYLHNFIDALGMEVPVVW